MFCIEQIKVKNFLSFGSDIQTFTFADKGMHWIDGINVDESDSTGKRSVGSGKCLHPETTIEVLIEDKQCLNDFLNFIK